MLNDVLSGLYTYDLGQSWMNSRLSNSTFALKEATIQKALPYNLEEETK